LPTDRGYPSVSDSEPAGGAGGASILRLTRSDADSLESSFTLKASWSAGAAWRRLRAAVSAREGIVILDGMGVPTRAAPSSA
jgi:hypothetical protein